MSRFRLLSFVSLAAIASACSQPESTECGADGPICPPGWECITELSACINPLETSCGNGITEDGSNGTEDRGEKCDDGNLRNGDGCSWNCQLPTCGDRLVDTYLREGVEFTEVCDDGLNAQGVTASGDGCSSDCASIEVCGDGYRNPVDYPARDEDGNILIENRLPAEECDDGVVNNDGDKIDSAACNSDCTVARCGDNKINSVAGEICDPGTGTLAGSDNKLAQNPTNACNDNCTTSICGDERTNPVGPTSQTGGEQCDLGSYCADRTTKCTTAADCPAGLPDQLCIPRNIECCTAGCQDARCGDGVTQAQTCGELDPEVCDDGKYCESGVRCLVDADCPGAGANRCTTRNNAACSFDCKSVGICGDGYENNYPPFNEVCDDGKQCADGSACTNDAGCSEQLGADKTCIKRNTEACSADCKSTGVCGDGILNNYAPYNEVCDDGLRCADGTACSATSPCSGGGLCVKREGFGCSLSCNSNEVCGDKVVNNYPHPMVSEGFFRGRSVIVNNIPETQYDIEPGTAIVDSEICDNGEHCSDGTECDDDEDCAAIVGGDGLCKPRSGDGCSEDCLSEERCPDGYLNNYAHVDSEDAPRPAELCDDGNSTGDDGCNPSCSSSGVCGNAILDPGEQCDYGPSFNGIGAPPPAESPFCQPGAVGGQQACSDPCNRECTLNQCGNGLRDPGEECDDGRHCTNGGAVCEEDADCPGALVGSCQKREEDNCTNACRNNTCGDLIPNLVGGGAANLPIQVCDEGGTNTASCNFNCTLPICGDAITNFSFNETCDNGPGLAAGVTTESATCNTNCQIAFCGDGVANATRGEICDDADNIDGDGCAGNCLSAEVCGDGVANRYNITLVDTSNQITTIRPAEVCDGGPGGNATCTADCQSRVTCSDRYINALETCDDGNQTVNDGCSASCGIETGWACPTRSVTVGQPPTPGFITYNTTDRCAEVCGDGLVAGDETCDNGRTCTNGTACNSAVDCAGIGDGTCTARASDGCSATCRIERGWRCTVTNIGGGALHRNGGACTPICGDREMWGIEQCDDGNLTDDDGCSATCTEEPGFTCPGVTGGEAGTCQSNCGDGFIRGFEECDDDNVDPGDGCNEFCRIELGWICAERGDPTEGDLCVAECGDFVIRGLEQCDDGRQCLVNLGPDNVEGTRDDVLRACSTNADCLVGDAEATCETRIGDGCSATCAFEAGYSCPAGLEVIGGQCVAICGDGLVRGAETCDDDDTDSGDGCDSGCRAELGWTCPINIGVNGAGGTCAPTCGDGLIRGVETCDEGLAGSPATGQTGGCLACAQQSGWYCPTALLSGGLCASQCGDNIRVTTATASFIQNNEECDVGVLNSDSGDCTSGCTVATCDDGFRNFLGTHQETGVDCGGICLNETPAQRCGDGLGCVANADCVTNYCDPVGGVCAAPPLVGPTLYVLEGGELQIDVVATLFGGNTTIDLTTFELVDATDSACGGLVEYDSGVDPDLVVFTPEAAATANGAAEGCTVGVSADYTDTFAYRVCAFGGAPCFTETATIVVNRRPTLADAARCFPVNTANAQLDVSTLYADLDGDAINPASITNTGAGGSHSKTGTTVTFTPTSPATGAAFTVALNACDVSNTPGCDTATWSLQWNDPPVLAGRTGGSTINVFVGESAAGVPLYTVPTRIVTSNGNVNNAISSVTVGAFAGGPFGATSTTARGSCTVSGDNIVYTAGSVTGADSCFVRVCEGCSGTEVCSVTELAYNLVALPVANDDQVFGLEAAVPAAAGATATFTVASLQSNDTPAGLVNFAFVSATTLCNGTVVNNAGTITYTGPSNLAPVSTCRTNDSFSYQVCSPAITARCDTATVHIEINQRPVLADTFTCSPINTPSRSLNVRDLFTDPDSDELVNSSILATGTGGASSRVGSVVTWTPTAPATATTYSVALTACDDGSVSGCDTSTWTAVWNDPPVLRTFPDTSPIPVERSTAAAAISLESGGSRIITSTGTVTGVQGVTNPIASTGVGAFATGPFSATTVNTTLGTCVISGGNVTYTAGATSGNDSCFVQVCESCSGNSVCSVTRIPFKVVDPPVPGPDTIIAVEQANGTATVTVSIATLLANDTLANAASFLLANGSGTPDCGGTTVSIVGQNVVYTIAAGRTGGCLTADTFNYTVASPDIPTLIREGTVSVTINRRPTLANALTCMPVNSIRANYTVGPPNFADADNNGVGTVAVTNTSGGAGFASVAGPVVTWAPDNQSLPAYYDLTLSACDNSSSPACTTGNWQVAWNDLPILGSTFSLGCEPAANATICTATGQSVDLPLEGTDPNRLITNFGGITGVPINESPLGTVTVTAQATSGSCTIVNDVNGKPTHVRYTPTNNAATTSCTIQVCEVCSGGAVCSSRVINYNVIEAPEPGDDEFTVNASVTLPGVSATVPRAHFTGNDGNVTESSFELVGGASVATTCGGTAAITGSGSGTGVAYTRPTDIQMAAPGCAYLDTFEYRVKITGTQIFVTGFVRVRLNRPPVLDLSNDFTCRATGTTSVDLLIETPRYTDPNDGTGALSALTAITTPTNYASAVFGTKTVTLTPPTSTAARYAVTVTATDNASNTPVNGRGTDSDVWNVVWNDQPVFETVATTAVVAGTNAAAKTFASIVTSFGTQNGLPTGSVASPWASVLVGDDMAGPFAATADLGDGSSCAVTGTLAASTIGFTAGNVGGTKTCYVQVCEVCTGSTPVCAVKALDYNIIDVNDDTASAVEQVALPILASTLLTNDVGIDAATFSLIDGTDAPVTSTATSDGGTVSFATGTVTYTSKVAPAATDTFRYRACVTGGSVCGIGTVTVTVNRLPTLAAASTCVPLNTATVSLDLNPAQNPTFTDADSDGLGAVTPTAAVPGVPGDADDGTLAAGIAPNELLFTPDVTSAAAVFTASYQACDDGDPAACRNGTWTVLYNDAPTFKAAAASFAVNGPKTINLATGANPEDLIQTFGTVNSGSLTVRVSDTQGVYPGAPGDDQIATLTNGTCAVNNGTIVFTPSGTPSADTDSCFVEVCECTGVCAEKEVVFTLVGCLVAGDCTNEPADDCSGNIPQSYPGVCNVSGDCEYNAVPGTACTNGCFAGTCNAQAPAFSAPATGVEDGTAFSVTFDEVASLGVSNGLAPADVDVRVRIEVGPAGGLQALTLNWTANNFANTTPVTMTKMGQNAGNDVYEAVIPGQEWMTTVRFYLEADPWTGANFFDPGNDTNYTYVTEECTRNAHCTTSAGGVCDVDNLCVYPPAAPTGVGGIQDVPGTVIVSWTAAGTGGSPITGYTATLYQGGNPTALTCTDTATICSVTSVPAGTYTAVVFATNAIGNSPNSAPSASFVVTAP